MGIAVGAVAWDAYAPETLSGAFSRGRRHPAGRILVPAGWLVLTAHLFGALPPQVDPFHQLMRVLRQSSQPSDRAARSQRTGL